MMNKLSELDYEYAKHFCSLKEAKYAVLETRELEYGYNNGNGIHCFKELKWAKQCYKKSQPDTGYPKIIDSRLIEMKDI